MFYNQTTQTVDEEATAQDMKSSTEIKKPLYDTKLLCSFFYGLALGKWFLIKPLTRSFQEAAVENPFNVLYFGSRCW